MVGLFSVIHKIDWVIFDFNWKLVLKILFVDFCYISVEKINRKIWDAYHYLT